MRTTTRRRLAHARDTLTHAGERHGDWLGVVIRVQLAARPDGADPPADEVVLARHWALTPAEAARRVRLHQAFLEARHPDLWAMLMDPDAHPDLVRRLAEAGHPVFSGFPRFGDSTGPDEAKCEKEDVPDLPPEPPC